MRRFVLILAVLAILAPAFARGATRVAVAGLAPGEFAEGDSGLTQVTAFIRLAQPSTSPITGTYQTVDGTATAADNDYVPAFGIFVIDAGESETTVTVNIVGDTTVEDDETFSIAFTNVSNPPLVVTIVNDDTPTLTVANASISEGDGGTTPLVFTVTLTEAAAIPVQATYTTVDGTAVAGEDYQAAAGTLSFAPGETERAITVNVVGDTKLEPDETFSVSVTPSQGPSSATAIGTILNDDVRAPTGLAIVSGNGQSGIIGQRLAQPLVVQVVDQEGAPSPGATVQWVVTSGSAQLDPATSTTGADGRAGTNVTLDTLGPIEIEAVVAGLAPVTFTLGAVTALEARATGPVAVPIARVLDGICARNEQTFNLVCSALGRLDGEQLTPALERVAPQQSGAQAEVASEVMSVVTSGIGARLSAVRSGVQRFSLQQFSLRSNGREVPVTLLAKALFSSAAEQQSDAGGIAEDEYSGWSAFLSGNLGSGERRPRDGEIGFDLETRGVMVGLDRQFGEAIFGASVNLMQLDAKLDDAAGKLDTTGYAVSLYGSRGGLFGANTNPGTGSGTRYDGVHIDGSVSFGRNSYEAQHDVQIGPLPIATARSENDANVLAVSAGAGVDVHRGRTDFNATLSGTWSRASIDDLTEEGSGPLILFVQGHEIESLVATAGLSVRSAIPVSFGVLLPTFRGELIRELEDGARLVTARFLRDTEAASFTIPLDRADASYARLAAGLQAVLPRGVSVYVEVTQDMLRDDLRYRNIQFNVSKSF